MSPHRQAKVRKRKETKGNPKENPKEPEVPNKVPKAKYQRQIQSETSLSGLENSESETNSGIQEMCFLGRYKSFLLDASNWLLTFSEVEGGANQL